MAATTAVDGSILIQSEEEIKRLCSDDEAMIALANSHREGLFSKPTQSDFRVLALLVVEKSNGSLIMIRGSNTESAYIGVSICAERAAICSLRFLDKPIIRRVAVVTDSSTPISPGVLCREYLTSLANRDTVVVIGNNSGSKIVNCTLADLYPYPYVYRAQTRSSILQFAAQFSRRMKSVTELDEQSQIRRVISAAAAANSFDKFDKVHPLRFSAAVLFDDNSTENAWLLKGIEFGNTCDPVSQLVHVMERRNAANYCVPCHGQLEFKGVQLTATAVMIVMVDQFGVAHAPFAPARSLLTEHGYTGVKIVVHNEEGHLEVCTAAELVTQPPGDSTMLTHDDF